MRVRRNYRNRDGLSGFHEDIDLGTVDGYDYFYKWVVGNEAVADNILAHVKSLDVGQTYLTVVRGMPESYTVLGVPSVTEQDQAGVDFIGAVWHYLDQTNGDESNLFDLLEQAVKTWEP